jgi:molybdate transport system permease protein
VSPFAVSLRVVLPALVFVVPLGAAAGHFLARGRGPLRAALDALVLVPLVLPPSVVGYGLLLVLGRHGAIGSLLEKMFDVRLVFTSAGASIAAVAVALPLMAKAAEAAFARVDKNLEDAALANGLSRAATFRIVTLPLALPGLAAATTLAALRALGEFGATLTFAGYSSQTATAPLEVYFAMQQGKDARALSLSLALVVVSTAAALAFHAWSRKR